MARSNKDAWLRSGAGDLATEDVVVDFPNPGDTVKVRALPASYSARVSSQFVIENEGTGKQKSRIDVETMEVLQFAGGVIEPEFTEAEARQIAENFGPVFRKVIEVIDRLSGVNKEEVKAAEARFLDSGESRNGSAVADGDTAGGSGGSGESAVSSSAGAPTGDAGRGDV